MGGVDESIPTSRLRNCHQDMRDGFHGGKRAGPESYAQRNIICAVDTCPKGIRALGVPSGQSLASTWTLRYVGFGRIIFNNEDVHWQDFRIITCSSGGHAPINST